MSPKPTMPMNLVNVRGTELLAADSRERYRQKIARITLDSMAQFVGLLDAQGTVLEINQVALDAVGIKLSDVEGKPFWKTFWWQVSEEVNTTLKESIRRASQGEFVRWDAEIYGRAGGKETIIIDASLMPVKDEQGNVVFITAEGRDITEKKAHEREIARQREELAQLDKLKTQFFANISYEFRTPLTLMMGPLEDALAQPDGLTAADRERLELAHRNSVRLLKLVNALLDFARIEAGRIEASYEPTDLARLTADLASVFRSTIERAGMRLVIECPALPEMVYVDREMWEKVVLNLLSNAFKFTFDGEIKVSLRLEDPVVQMTVSDTGTGIPADELPRLFERFHRVKGARGRSYEGSGIGLALVQELVKLHGGNVSVESEAGRGSRFVITIPLGNAHLPADRIHASRGLLSTALAAEAYVEELERWLPQDSDISLEPLSERLPLPTNGAAALPATRKELVVVADDNADMRDYLAHLLRGKYRVHAVANGIEAVDATRELHPALVLTDVMMPGLDGLGVLDAIRGDHSLSSTPVILLSARAGEESRVEGLEAGADDYLVKPFTARELLARVAMHVRMANLRREATEQVRESDERFRAIVDATPECVKLVARDGTLLHMNLAGLTLVGADRLDEVVGKSIYELIAEEDRDRYRQFNERVCEGERGSLRFDIIGVTGLRRHMDTHAVPLRNGDGSVIQLAVTRDVSEHKRAHEASQRLSAIVSSSDDAIVSKDLKGIVTSWNAAAEKMFGFTADEIIGEPITKIIPLELRQDEIEILATIARGERIEHFETVRLRKTGERVEVSLTVSPLKDDTGRIVGAAKIARDITQRKKAEHALHTAEKLASVGRLAATIAHEINNPLEALTNLIYLAKNASAESEVLGYLTGAEEELERVSHLTRQTLGFYRETKGASKVRVGTMVTPLIAVFGSRTRNKGIEIYPEIKEDPEIRAVPGEIRQLVANLLGNSIDAVEGGGLIRVRVSAATEWLESRREGVRITVADTGAGIPREFQSQLFEPFFTTKKEVGTGLGLWVCKSIVGKHHGTIRLKSSTQQGKSWTVFSVFLPRDVEQPIEQKEVVKRAV